MENNYFMGQLFDVWHMVGSHSFFSLSLRAMKRYVELPCVLLCMPAYREQPDLSTRVERMPKF